MRARTSCPTTPRWRSPAHFMKPFHAVLATVPAGAKKAERRTQASGARAAIQMPENSLRGASGRPTHLDHRPESPDFAVNCKLAAGSLDDSNQVEGSRS